MIAEAELDTLAQILRDAARTEILPRFRALPPGGVRAKTSAQDLVTDADEAAELLIASALAQRFPGALVVGEEAASRTPGMIDQLAAAPLAFVVDPIDGTANYAAGLPLFGVMAACVEDGHTTGAIILDPIADSFSAARAGAGAYEQDAAGRRVPLRLAPPRPLGELTGMASWRFLPPARRQRMLAGLTRLANTWDHRCAAHEYRALVAGHSHFVLFNRLMPWDHLPGVLLVQESGGFTARFDGSAYRPGQTGGGLICTSDQATWQALHAALLDEEEQD